ncbi:MAG: DUF4149 domain-containing protein [Neisseria sp.]|nr:DUF4149 domain-containing protein [Neisseria sp.]
MRIKFELVLLIAWLGCLGCAGYLVAPVLFAHLPKMTAGDLAGKLFHYVSYIGLAATVGLLLSGCLNERCGFIKSARGRWLLFAGALTLINEFLITPVIVALKTNTHHWLPERFGDSFAAWHGVSQTVYLLTFICLLALAWSWAQWLGKR